MRTGSPAAPRRRNRDCQSTRCPCLAATTYAHADPVRSSSTAMGRRAHCTELWHREDLLDWLLSDRRRLGKLAAHVAKLLVLRQSQFFDHTAGRSQTTEGGWHADGNSLERLTEDARRRR